MKTNTTSSVPSKNNVSTPFKTNPLPGGVQTDQEAAQKAGSERSSSQQEANRRFRGSGGAGPLFPSDYGQSPDSGPTGTSAVPQFRIAGSGVANANTASVAGNENNATGTAQRQYDACATNPTLPVCVGSRTTQKAPTVTEQSAGSKRRRRTKKKTKRTKRKRRSLKSKRSKRRSKKGKKATKTRKKKVVSKKKKIVSRKKKRGGDPSKDSKPIVRNIFYSAIWAGENQEHNEKEAIDLIKKPDFDPNQKSDNGISLIQLAMNAKNMKILKMLIENPNTDIDDKKDILRQAIANNNKEIINMFLINGKLPKDYKEFKDLI